MDHSMHGMAGMDMGDSSMEGHSGGHSMNMVFTSKALHYPVLFSGLEAHTNSQVFAIVVLIIATAVVYRGVVALRQFLESKYWAYSACQPAVETEATKATSLSIQNSLVRDSGRFLLTFLSATLGYALMLIVMTFVLPYFFAVVLGLALSEFMFSRLLKTYHPDVAGVACCA